MGMYKELLEIDLRLGTSTVEQLHWCVQYTSRLDLVKVWVREK